MERIAITTGDPAGIGPELALRAAAHAAIREQCVPVIFGDAALLHRVAEACGLPVPERVVSKGDWEAKYDELDRPTILDLTAIDAAEVRPGSVNASTGRAAYAYVETAIQAALAGEVAAITTGPLHKEALHAAGVPYPGHTEILAALTQSDRVCMMLTSAEITCSLVTTHVGYGEVLEHLDADLVVQTIELTDAALRRIRGRPPRLLVCGLNPHAGEHGLFGNREEERFIKPAIEAARRRGVDVRGPLPADTAFLPARRAETDGYICMYHDQGLIPLKTLAFETAVNVTLGLPIIRTSVDHGTALDIAWQNRADLSSMLEAIRLAIRLVAQS